jgi:hypothetical protein
LNISVSSRFLYEITAASVPGISQLPAEAEAVRTAPAASGLIFSTLPVKGIISMTVG